MAPKTPPSMQGLASLASGRPSPSPESHSLPGEPPEAAPGMWIRAPGTSRHTVFTCVSLHLIVYHGFNSAEVPWGLLALGTFLKNI